MPNKVDFYFPISFVLNLIYDIFKNLIILIILQKKEDLQACQ